MNLFSQGIDPEILLRHGRDPAHPSSTAPHCPSTSVTRGAATSSTRPSPAPTRTPSRRASRTPPGEGEGHEHRRPRLGRAVPADRPARHRPLLRGRRPGQQPVRQGRGVVPAQGREHGLDLPRRLQVEFSHVVQRRTDTEGGELSGPRSGRCSPTSTCTPSRPTTGGAGSARCARRSPAPTTAPTSSTPSSGSTGRHPGPRPRQRTHRRLHRGLATLDVDVRVLDYHEHALRPVATPARPPTSSAPSATASCGASACTSRSSRPSLRAILSAVNRAERAPAEG